MSYFDFAKGCLAAGFSGGLSVAIMNPLDTLKVRVQVATNPGSLTAFARDVVTKEGFYRGLLAPGVAANFWGIGISSVGRVGCYPYVRDKLLAAAGATEKSGGVMFLAGLLAGGVGYLASSPVYQIKTLAQAEAGVVVDGVLTTGGRAGSAPRFHSHSLLGGLSTLKRDGQLWRGSGALLVRGALLSAGMQVGYDGVKTLAKRRGVAEGSGLHAVASAAGAVGACVCATPADVVMTRYQAAGMSGKNAHASALACAADVVRTDGPLALYRGFTPFVVRLGPVFIISLPLTEQIRRMMGLGYM